MIHAQYNRLGLHVSASRRDVVRAAHTLLSAKGRSRAMRDERHRWLRAILVEHEKAFALFLAVQSGKLKGVL